MFLVPLHIKGTVLADDTSKISHFVFHLPHCAIVLSFQNTTTRTQCYRQKIDPQIWADLQLFLFLYNFRSVSFCLSGINKSNQLYLVITWV